MQGQPLYPTPCTLEEEASRPTVHGPPALWSALSPADSHLVQARSKCIFRVAVPALRLGCPASQACPGLPGQTGLDALGSTEPPELPQGFPSRQPPLLAGILGGAPDIKF